MAKIFNKINQIAVLANQVRFKILLALFNSNIFKHKGKKLGAHSHSFSDLKEIINVEKNDLTYHLNILMSSSLIEKVKKFKGFYHITPDAKKILSEFGVTKELVNKEGNKLI